MTIKKEAKLDLVTGEVTYQEFTAEELASYLEDQTEYKKQQKARVAEIAAKETARQSALDKLLGLGLTPEEISAITGA
jgi:hypothetical protein